MHPTTPSRVKTRYYLALLAVLILSPLASTFAQERDPFALEASERSRASLPLPFGLIGGISYPALGGTGDDDLSPITRFNISAYIDAWQLGFATKDYGNMFSLMMRKVGRDVSSGWYLEYGGKSVQVPLPNQSQGDDRDSTFTLTNYGLGFVLSGGFSDKVKMYWTYGTTFGLSSVDGISDDDEDDFSSDAITTRIYMDVNAGIGARIPAGPLGIVVMGTGAFGLMPGGVLFTGESGEEQYFFYSLGIGTTIALNLQFD